MQTIWKFPLKFPVEEVLMPAGADVLKVDTQGPFNGIVLWALVDEARPLEKRTFLVLATGQMIEPRVTPKQYLGSVQLMGGELIFHIFEQPLEKPDA